MYSVPSARLKATGSAKTLRATSMSHCAALHGTRTLRQSNVLKPITVTHALPRGSSKTVYVTAFMYRTPPLATHPAVGDTLVRKYITTEHGERVGVRYPSPAMANAYIQMQERARMEEQRLLNRNVTSI